VSRPTKTLLERVLENSFRPGRHGHLLAGELLPAEPPRGFRTARKRHVWARLREWQAGWQRERKPSVRAQAASDFSAMVKHLHGGGEPDWFDGLRRVARD
jgi:hypothetical protein